MAEQNPYETPGLQAAESAARAAVQPPQSRLTGFRWRTIPATLLGFVGVGLLGAAANLCIDVATRPPRPGMPLGLVVGPVAVMACVAAMGIALLTAAASLWHARWLRCVVSLAVAAGLYGAGWLAFVIWVAPHLGS